MIIKIDQIPDYFSTHEEGGFQYTVVELINGYDINKDLFISLQYHFRSDAVEEISRWFHVGKNDQYAQEATEGNILNYNHVVGVASQERNSLSLYLNGKKINERGWDGTIGESINSWYLGHFSDEFINIKINVDELRIYNRALTESEIQQIIGL